MKSKEHIIFSGDIEISEFVWKVFVKNIAGNNYNLDIKKSHIIDENHGDPKELLNGYLQLEKDAGITRDKLKAELMASLGGN